ncbi:glucuronate isomerase [Streptococcus ovuberis]|uniref:Uronate isomerase n=1 Tax=Streptococcus ovuberis TaxID=1936207 RepID=A0A7X6MX87_9STRE|nr:glucuronate isomerase [Streptococcus ovuberis]NKZ19439.1 glucuronate isomerase [Streptococcus ovuberis]
MAFNDQDFMLRGQAAKRLYEIAKDMPIYDFHCHLDPRAIFEDKPYDNIVDLWLDGDHYKWRLMRANGVSEELITGSAPKAEKFRVWIETVSRAFGNPLYHWSHLELKTVFGIDEVIKAENWESLYERLNAKLATGSITPRSLLKLSDVRFVGTTDHPLDDLEWHQKIAADETIAVRVAPTFRPDEVFVAHANFTSFIGALADKTGQVILTFEELVEALDQRIAYFAAQGCRASDISFGAVQFLETTKDQLNAILKKALAGQELTELEKNQWQSGIFLELCKLYHKHGLVTQVHFGAVRNSHSRLYAKLGADSGFDSMGDQIALADHLNRFLDALSKEDQLPKMIWYTLNPTYNSILANTLANFQANEEGTKSQLQFGAGWWFNDTKTGMLDQMTHYAEQGLLANFIGMLTDSRSFMSFQRHDYFRRILASLIGKWVDDEDIPNDLELLKPFVEGICFTNAETFFGN